MSYITIAEGKIKTYESDDSGQTVNSQAVVPVDSSGSPVDLATQTTLAALKASVDALSAKIAACDTGSVTLDATTLAALENITAAISGTVSISNFPTTQAISGTVAISNPTGLTDAELRATPLSVSMDSSPLPADAATETTLATVSSKLPALEGGRIPVSLPSGSSGLTNTELRAVPLETLPSPSVFAEMLAYRAVAKMTYTLTGQRVDCGGSSVAIAANQTLTSLAGIGLNTQLGQSIQQSQLAVQSGFRRNLT